MSLKFYLSVSFCLFFIWLYTLIKCDELPKYENLWVTNKTINALSSIVFFYFSNFSYVTGVRYFMSFAVETEKLVHELIQAEYKNACDKWGEKYHSLHEGYAVLLEEIEEANEDMTRIKYSLEDFWKWIKQDTKINPKDIDIVIEEYLKYCISELAQVGAVFMKIKNTSEVTNEN